MHVFGFVRKPAFFLTFAFLFIYALTRLTNLTLLPIFTDEAIYIRWSQIGAGDANWRFISLTDGKQPMFTWVTMALLRLLPSDPLFAGRFTSVLAGLGTLVGVWFVTHVLFRKHTVAWVAAFLYLISPFTLWYDRMAMYDSLVSMFFVWSLYLSIRLVRSLRLDIALLLGMVLGFGMLNKSSGFLSLYLLPFTLFLFDWKEKQLTRRLIRWVGLVAVAATLSQLFYSVLRLSPFFYIIGQKDNVFIFSIQEWLAQPFRFFAGNLRGMSDWVRTYMTLPVFVAAFLPFFFRWGNWPARLLLYAWSMAPLVLLANFGKVLYPRFVLFMTIPLLIVASDSIVELLGKIRRPLVKLVLCGLVFLPSMYVGYKIVTDPLDAPIPYSDRSQYVEDWPSGWGVPEVVSYLDAQAKSGPVTVYTEGTFGLFPYALEIYLGHNPNFTIVGIWPLPTVFPPEIIEAARKQPTYFVTNQTQALPPSWPLTLIGEYQKGTRDGVYMRLYQVQSAHTSSL